MAVSVRRAGYALVGGGRVGEGCDGRRGGRGRAACVYDVCGRSLRRWSRRSCVTVAADGSADRAQDDIIIVTKTGQATADWALFAHRRRARATEARCTDMVKPELGPADKVSGSIEVVEVAAQL